MVRVKRGVTKRKRRKKIIKMAKGYRWARKSKYRLAKQAVIKALVYAYRDRRTRKREFRKLWQIQIQSACRERNKKYSEFIHALKEKNIELDRKILAQLAQDYPEIFSKVFEEAFEPVKQESET